LGLPEVAFDHDRAMVISRQDRIPAIDEYLRSRGLRRAMAAALWGESGRIGMLVVGERNGAGASFGRDDRRLFETFARQTAIALDNARLQRELERQAFHDPLTGLANRALFADRMEHALARRGSDGRGVALLFADLDDFKTVNDRFGHAAGDGLLAAVGDRLQGCLRPFDTSARLGGDEFAILLEEVREQSEAVHVADRILAAFGKPFELDGGHEVSVHCSLGIVVSPPVPGDADDLVRAADAAMYGAKHAGKGRMQVFEPASASKAASRGSRLTADGRIRRESAAEPEPALGR
jgi:diguanylate cyclase (GGDEF)-like protein